MLNAETVKYTAMIRADDLKFLKELSLRKIIPSINHGIRTAIAEFLASERKKFYEAAMQEASKDESFLARMNEAERDFSAIDDEAFQNDQ